MKLKQPEKGYKFAGMGTGYCDACQVGGLILILDNGGGCEELNNGLDIGLCLTCIITEFCNISLESYNLSDNQKEFYSNFLKVIEDNKTNQDKEKIKYLSERISEDQLELNRLKEKYGN